MQLSVKDALAHSPFHTLALSLTDGGSDDAPVSWNRRDLLLYAVGVGAGPDELDYTYEASNNFRSIPSYPLVLGLKGNSDDTNVFADQIASRSGTPGLPRLDPNTVRESMEKARSDAT